MYSSEFSAPRLADVYAGDAAAISVEIFPPKTTKGDEALRDVLDRVKSFAPAFISCTYGAGGSTRDRTLGWCKEVQNDFGLPVTAHFTCVGSTREELVEWLGRASDAGVRNIMALRGDAPDGADAFEATAGGCRYASELVALIRSEFPTDAFGIGVAGYPETHPDAASPTADLDALVRKVEAGADAVFTQLFFDNSHFLRYRDALEARGVTLPIVPGVMPVTNYDRIRRITSMCGASFPPALAGPLADARDDPAAQFEIGVAWAIRQCRELLDAGVPGIHLYALNKSDAAERILAELGPVEAAA
ncbi:MAG: methylenetetrahydrofolate reductase [NAD(P)H] [Planctomycetota bacterium]